MKYVKNMIWFMVLIWFTTVAFNSVYDIYAAGGLWRTSAFILFALMATLWVLTMHAAYKTITKNKNQINKPV